MTTQSIKLLGVSQKAATIETLRELQLIGHELQVTWEPRIDRVLERFETATYDILVVTDAVFREDEIDSVEVLEVLAVKSPVTQVIFLVEPKHIQTIGSVLQAGTYQYAKSPVSDEELRLLIEAALAQRPQYGTNQLLKTDTASVQFERLVGQSGAMQEVYRQIEQAAATDLPVLILGETGTGKELVAQAIHQQSERKDGPYITVNTGALPVELVGSELFGHEKGAYTGATEHREGKFEQGNHGTVFLDEVGSIDEKVQVSLLRLIEQKKFHRLGGRRQIASDVRLVAATNADLMDLVRQGLFREDLFYRLDVFRISLPPLKKRAGDIPLLTELFLGRSNQAFQKNIQTIAPECVRLLKAYDWPGNIRELKNVIQRAALVCEEENLTPQHLPSRFRARVDSRPTLTLEVETTLLEAERRLIQRALSYTSNNRTRTASLLGISRRALYNKLRRHSID